MKRHIRRIFILTAFMLALGLIFLPMIFDNEDTAQPQLTSRIPPAPAVPTLARPEPARPVILADTPAINVPQAERAVENAAEPWREIPILDERGLPRGWSLRLGQFADVAEARQLLERLMEAGYRAYIREQRDSAVLSSAVLIGPWLVEETALEYRARLAREFGITGAIIPYELQRF